MAAFSDSLRIATYNTELSRDGPGLLLRDILSGEDTQVEAVSQVIAQTRPDVILLQNIDYDFDLFALAALRDRVEAHGHNLKHVFALPPNTGVPTGIDMNGDGRIGLPHDAQSYGQFQGQGGMAILSRYPIETEQVRDFSQTLWKALPQAKLPVWQDAPFPSQEAQDILRLSSTGHWLVPITTKSGRVILLAFHAGPSVFDGPEDRNGLRNHDEILMLRWILDAHLEQGDVPWIVLGNANIDPVDGEGRKAAIRSLLADDRLQDPKPKRDSNVPTLSNRIGDPALHTVAWPEDGPGPLRVSYILPQAALRLLPSGVYWGDGSEENTEVVQSASRHRLVWLDIELP